MQLRYTVLSLVMLVALWGCAPQVVQPPAPQLPPSQPPPLQPPPYVPPAEVPPPKSPVKPPPPPPRTVQPRETPPSPSMVASAQWVDEAIRAIDVGNHERATALLERAISVEPNNGHAFYYYGLAMGERGETRAALTLLRKAEILLRGDRQALGNIYAQMGMNLERLGRREEAIQRYGQALAQAPTHALARRRLHELKK